MSDKWLLACASALTLGVVACSTAALSDQNTSGAQSSAKVASLGAHKVSIRRLTETQYRNTIADVFGPDIEINARFEPERRENGLQAIGNSQLSITTSGLEQYYSLAASIADQVVASDRRDEIIGCMPANPEAADSTCAKEFISSHGERLFRRPLTDKEIAARVALVSETATKTEDFYAGLKLGLVSLLASPEYLLRVETAEPDPTNPDKLRFDGYTKASRLSFLLWDSAPDVELLQSAKSGAIQSEAEMQRQIQRMVASARLKDGAEAFFTDMLQFDAFESLSKDPTTYPKFSQAVSDSAREETLKFLVKHLIDDNRDYRDIFTAQETVINRSLAAVYDVPYTSKQEWKTFTFDPSDERSGILTQAAFLSLNAHPAASSPTRRGIKLNEIFQCVPTPDPPADVDFSKVQATQNGTVRTRLIDHMTNPGCSTCHAISDPVGLTLEHFDGLGQRRLMENGQLIDVSAQIGDKKFSGAQGLGRYLHDSPLVPACLVRNVYYYGVGQAPDYKDQAYLNKQVEAFAEDDYRLSHLFANIANSPEFFDVKLPEDLVVKPTSDSAEVSRKPVSVGEGQ